MARSVPDSAWIPALAEVGVVVTDPTTFATTLASMTDANVIRTIVRLTLEEQVPECIDAQASALVQTNAAWEEALNAIMDANRKEMRAMFPNWTFKI